MNCTACGYDLRGSHPEGRCPECGMPLRASAAISRVGWTPMLGLRRGAIHLAIQITVWTAGVAGALLLFQPVLRWFVARSLGGLGLLLLVGAAIVAGLVLSRAIWTRLQERVGFSGAIVGLVAVVATVVIAGGSGAIAGAFGVSSVLSGPIGLAIVGTVLVRVIHDVALDG